MFMPDETPDPGVPRGAGLGGVAARLDGMLEDRLRGLPTGRHTNKSWRDREDRVVRGPGPEGAGLLYLFALRGCFSAAMLQGEAPLLRLERTRILLSEGPGGSTQPCSLTWSSLSNPGALQ